MDFLQTFKIKRLPRYIYNYFKDTKNTLIELDLGVYWFWAGLRVFLTVLPQTGYIHPDEYFQTVEVSAGDVFDVEVSVPWEFNSTFPIRSVPVIYTVIHIPFSLLKSISHLVESHFGFNILGHYLLLVVPRLSMCLLSFISDICLFQVCYYFQQNYRERLVIYASSFVCLVFMTRTFTNAVEIICFNILLCLVSLSMAKSETVIYQNDVLNKKFSEASTIPDRVRIRKLFKLLPKHSLTKCVPIAIVTVTGFFNRPTFFLYAFTPLFFWFQRGLDSKPSFFRDFHIRMFVFLLYCIPISCFFIYFDSAYYGYITWGEVLNWDIGVDNFVITPYNFIKYNLNPTNLSKHGLHPRFLHILINIPLLFNVLGVSGLLVVVKLLYRGTFSNWTLLPRSQSITGMMTMSFLLPVLGLSIMPHQEPRFITPILLPLVFLYSHLIRDFQEHCETSMPFQKRNPKKKEIHGLLKYPLKCVVYLEKVTENFDNRYYIYGRPLAELKGQEIVEKKNFPERDLVVVNEDEECKSNKKFDLTKLWYLFNIICVLFFGFIHQGGVYGLSKDFHKKLLVKPRYTTYHLITSHVYSFPVHLLAVKKSHKWKNTNFEVYELGSENFEKINLKLATILKLAESKKKSARRNYKIFYAFPTSLLREFRSHQNHFSSNYTYDIENVFYPHMSTEALPNFSFAASDETGFEFFDKFTFSTLLDWMPVKYLFALFQQCGLILVQINLPKTL